MVWKNREKSSWKIWSEDKKVFIFAPASREGRQLAAVREEEANRFWEVLDKKSDWKIWTERKFFLPLQPARRSVMAERRKRTGSEELTKKNLSKRFGGFKNNAYLCTTFRWKKAVSQAVQSKDLGPEKTEDVLIAIYEQRSLK